MRFSRKLIYAAVFTIAVFSLSMFVKIIPCQTAPSVPNPEYSWTFCSLNPDQANRGGISRKYFGYTTILSETYIIVILLSYVIALMVLFPIKRRD